MDSKQAPGQLWAKGIATDALMHELTVGNDYLLDRVFIKYDCLASAAHARMLNKVGLLAAEDLRRLVDELRVLHELAAAGRLEIPSSCEDCHTFIENQLTAKLGEAGLRIHTGRSRNDQVLVSARLYARDVLLGWLEQQASLCRTIMTRYDELKDIPMPGYTHMQPAMPSSVGMWLHAWLEGGLEVLREGLFILDEINANPLGAAAGYGSSLPLDREFTAKLLAFSRLQRSPIDAIASRGRYEEKILRVALDAVSILEKMASDIMLYSTREFGFFALPVELTTGSSIMPQKKNCDIVELLRARGGKIRGAAAELAAITTKLPTSYNRDVQYTKEPFLRAASEMTQIFRMAELIIARLGVNQERLRQAMYPDLYATYEAYRRVARGAPFRTAYREVAEIVERGALDQPDLSRDFLEVQQLCAGDVARAGDELHSHEKSVGGWRRIISEVETRVFAGGSDPERQPSPE